MFDLNFESKELNNYLNKVADRLENREQLFRDIGKVLVNSTKNSFATEKTPGGRRWKKSNKKIGQTLTKTRRLRNSIESYSDNERVIIGTNVEYGKYHQHGTQNLPKRQFLGMSRDDRLDIEDLVDTYYTE